MLGPDLNIRLTVSVVREFVFSFPFRILKDDQQGKRSARVWGWLEGLYLDHFPQDVEQAYWPVVLWKHIIFNLGTTS